MKPVAVSGAEGYVLKGADPEELLVAIRAAARGTRTSAPIR